MRLPASSMMKPFRSARTARLVRFDLISIFPDYFASLRLSLMGKAEDAGLVQLQAHDLRDWASGKHRSVDDTPYGGGAGMVMRADVWARALDEVLSVPLTRGDGERTDASPRRILAIPTPSGVAEHYRGSGVEVVEFSIGDYVLNGGEVAAMVLTEAVARLLEGFMGNPDSLVEESHSGAGLLEYPVYTKPREFRSLEIPEVLLGGNHAAIERWRRDRAIEKTVRVRPDLALRLDSSSLTHEDRAALAACGIAYPRAGVAERLEIRLATLEDTVAVSELAARTFPDACPANLPREAIDEHIATQLSVDVFEALICAPDHHRLFVAEVWGGLIGYVLTHVGVHGLPSELVRPGRVEEGSAYLSKCYVDEAWRGSGVADALLERAVADAREIGHVAVVLGTNRGNKTAQAFYKRHGFRKRSSRTFAVGGVQNYDFVMVRDLGD